MRLEAALLAVMLSLSGPGLFAQTPRPTKPKPVEDVPPPDILPVPTQQTSAVRTWAMFNNEPWPSEQTLASLTKGCNGAHGIRGGFFLYDLGPSSQQTLMLEKIAQDLKKEPFFMRRRMVIVPLNSPEINAWDVNSEDVLFARGLQPNEVRASLICVPQGMIDFYLDAPEELEAVIAHEMGHAVDAACYRDARPNTALTQQTCESRADALALNVFIAQGKNPYAIAGAFGRLNMYIGDTSTGLFARLKNFASDHPLTPDRIRNLRLILLEAQRTHQLQPLPAIIR